MVLSDFFGQETGADGPQLGFAVGAGIGGIASGGGSMLPIIWMGAAAVALAAFISIVSVGLVRPSLKKMLRKS